jgi:hypothetical protein
MGAFHNVVVAVQIMVKLFIPVVKDQQWSYQELMAVAAVKHAMEDPGWL